MFREGMRGKTEESDSRFRKLELELQYSQEELQRRCVPSSNCLQIASIVINVIVDFPHKLDMKHALPCSQRTAQDRKVGFGQPPVDPDWPLRGPESASTRLLAALLSSAYGPRFWAGGVGAVPGHH